VIAICSPLCLRFSSIGCRVQGYTPLSEGLEPWIEHLILRPDTGLRLYRADRPHHPRSHAGGGCSRTISAPPRAKGIGQTGILFVHALKNAAVPSSR